MRGWVERRGHWGGLTLLPAFAAASRPPAASAPPPRSSPPCSGTRGLALPGDAGSREWPTWGRQMAPNGSQSSAAWSWTKGLQKEGSP